MATPPPIRVLFICRYNRRRSATAERVFCKDRALDVKSAGTSDEAMVRVTARMIDWADVVFVMDDELLESMRLEFPGEDVGKMVCLDIEDKYWFLQPDLIRLLEDRTAPHLERLKARSSSASGR